jgi:hypothetical protein
MEGQHHTRNNTSKGWPDGIVLRDRSPIQRNPGGKRCFREAEGAET